MRKVFDRNNYSFNRGEKIPFTDNVDRSSFIPLDIQYMRMMSAGANLENIRSYQYSTDSKYLDEYLKTHNISELTIDDTRSFRNMDKVELQSVLQEKMSKYRKYESDKAKLKQSYDDFMREKEIREKAVNDYKASLSLDNQKQTE